MRGAAATLITVGIGIAVAMPFVSALLLPGEAVSGVIGLILVLGGALCLAFHERGRPSWAVATFAATALVFVTSIFGFAVLRVDRHQSSPPLMAHIRQDSPGPSQVATYGFLSPDFRLLRRASGLVLYDGRGPPTVCRACTAAVYHHHQRP